MSNPDTENLIRLADIFDVDVNVLISSQLESKKDTLPQEHATDWTKTIRLLSALLAVAVCSTVLFGVLWATERFRKEEGPTITANESRWDSVKLYNYVSLKQVEVPLTEKDQATLASLVWNYRYTEKLKENTEIIYGGIHAKLVIKKNGVSYSWTFRPQAIYCSIKLTDGYVLNYEYEPDNRVFEYLSTFIEKE